MNIWKTFTKFVRIIQHVILITVIGQFLTFKLVVFVQAEWDANQIGSRLFCFRRKYSEWRSFLEKIKAVSFNLTD